MRPARRMHPPRLGDGRYDRGVFVEPSRRAAFAAACAVVILTHAVAAADAPAPAPAPRRVPWTTSRVTGSPDPAMPYRLERAFPRLKFANPVDITVAPGTDRLFVVEQHGKVYSFRNDARVEKPDLLIDLKKDVRSFDKVPTAKGVAAAYAIAIHPDFPAKSYCYLCYVLDVPVPGPGADVGSRVSRFTVVTGQDGVPRLDPASEVVMVEWRAGGHNGCALKFGPDGYLYISTGDAEVPSPPDPLATGQDLDDLLSCILRIDVNREADGRRYAIPADNPFVSTPGARPEIWAYGLRNPWRMSFDRATGALWIGDVGWELWEMIYRGVPGGNYGWSVTEGPQPVRGDVNPGLTPILPPALALPHSEAMSITGGYVYRGRQTPELVGHYVFGDWETRWIWASELRPDETLAPYRRIAQTDVRIIGFGEDDDGELLVLGYEEGGVYRIVKNDVSAAETAFPQTLEDTGLFESVSRHTPAPGVVPYVVNAPQWLDGLHAERWIAVPGSESVTVKDDKLAFPKDTVLLRTLFLDPPQTGAGAAANRPNRRPIETQLLHFDGRRWNGYDYRWNSEHSTAQLVDAPGASATYTTDDPSAPGGRRELTWAFGSRSQCMTCHNSFADFTLGYQAMQLDRPVAAPAPAPGAAAGNQLARLRALGLFPPQTKPQPAMADPHDGSADLDRRARSYLHANCAHCHRFGGGGSAMIDLRFELPPKQRRTVGEKPTLGAFELDDPRIVAPADPTRSVLLYRMAKTGRGRMPHIGSQLVDGRGLRLIEDWIRQMPAAAPATAGAAPPAPPALESTSGALALALKLERGELDAEARGRTVRDAVASPREPIRDLFERFAPRDQLADRLGPTVDAAKLLALSGDAGRGRDVFFGAGGVAAEAAGLCSQCHRVGEDGQSFGPDLTTIGAKYDRRALLEHIIEPSKHVDPQFATYVCRTTRGQDYSGVLVEKTADRIVLRDAQKHDVAVPAAEVQRLVPQKMSAMPEGLLSGLTPQQAADLLAFLAAQK